MTRRLRNFNIATRDKGGTWASLSLIAEYTLTGGKYCQRMRFRLQNNLGKPGPSNEVPAASSDCSTVTVKDGKVMFQEPGSTPLLSFDKDGLTATNPGQFVDYWQKLR